MIELLTIANRILDVLAALMPAAVLHWSTGRAQSRGQTLFGVHVQPGFPDSPAGQAIRSSFQRRLWSAAVCAVVLSLISPISLAWLVGFSSTSLAGSVLFALANRRTRRESDFVPAPGIRTASLVADSETHAWWLSLLDWLSMLLPPVVPGATLLIVALNWNRLPPHVRGGTAVFSTVFGLILTLACTANHWALRFRARASDWAPAPGASRQYRTYLGAMQSAVFAFITWDICVLLLMDLKGIVPFFPRIGMSTYFAVTFPVQALWLVLVWRTRFWLSSHLAHESLDPMPDAFWKWGYFYCNADDPALVVPLRSGVGQSYNCARPSVWIAGGIVTAAVIASLMQTIPFLAHAGR